MTDDKRQMLYDPMPRKNAELPPRMPEADTIARLTAELAEARADAAKARRFRDVARREAVEHHERAEKAERELADALAAQTRRDAQMTAKGMRAAAEWHQEVAQHDQGGIEYSGAVGIPISNMVELQQSVKMHQWSAEWLIALAAQTEASSDGS